MNFTKNRIGESIARIYSSNIFLFIFSFQISASLEFLFVDLNSTYIIYRVLFYIFIWAQTIIDEWELSIVDKAKKISSNGESFHLFDLEFRSFGLNAFELCIQIHFRTN